MFRYYIQIKKGKQNLKKYSNNINNSQFTYNSPNKMNFLYNKNINLEAKESKKNQIIIIIKIIKKKNIYQI
jgi:hypothetical protein